MILLLQLYNSSMEIAVSSSKNTRELSDKRYIYPPVNNGAELSQL